jgi:hypothetical protein
MSTNLNYKQVANVERRTWDTEAYEERAKARLKESSDDVSSKKKRKAPGSTTAANDEDAHPLMGEDEGTKEEFTPAAPGAAKSHKSDRAFLKSRSNRVDVDSKIGSVEIVNPDAAATTKSKVQDAGAVKVG